jgi:murein DD-endopeptidase MepM/ murein hydrolase activator NlpD
MREEYLSEVNKVDIKNLVPNKKKSKNKFIEFIEKKGFYIALLFCVTVIGVTAYVTSLGNSNYPQPDNNAINKGSVNATCTPNKKTAIDVPVQGDITKKIPTPKPTDSNTSKKSTNQKFILPVSGSVVFDYAQDKLVYSTTLDEWCSHSGVDLAADKGALVKAVADGVVSDIKNDPRFGVVIIIDHQNGLKSLYANLSSSDMVSPNQKVTQGMIIGSVGSSSTIEMAEPAHLHFEVLKNNKIVNPVTYLPTIPTTDPLDD